MESGRDQYSPPKRRPWGKPAVNRLLMRRIVGLCGESSIDVGLGWGRFVRGGGLGGAICQAPCLGMPRIRTGGESEARREHPS